MTEFGTHTALNVPTVTSFPSVNCLQWTGDGQVCFITKTAVYILTPDPGINFDTSSVIKTPLDVENTHDKPLGWFRTMIEFGKAPSHNWAEGSQEWGALSLGCLDQALRAVACSPSNLTSDAGCVLAVLNSNMELSLWTATKNFLKGEWMKIRDVTEFLIDVYSRDETQSPTMITLQAQTICVVWSSQPDFGIIPTPFLDGSLLVTGNRAGTLSFFRLESDKNAVFPLRCVQSLQVSDKWITQLAITSWTSIVPGTSQAHLAFGTSDGSIGLVKILQQVQSSKAASDFTTNYTTETLIENDVQYVSHPDKCGITALIWAETSGHSPILIHCKPGVVHLWSFPVPNSCWTGSRALTLRTQNLSVGSSSMSPVSGITHVRHENALIVVLFDGSFHVIYDLFIDPSWTPPNAGSQLTAEKLSAVSRSVFRRAEQGIIQRADVNRISGMSSYDGFGTISWLHEACRPSDFSYKHDARHNSMFIVTQMWDSANDEAFLYELLHILDGANASRGDAPIHILRPVFMYLRKNGLVPRLHTRVLDVLRHHCGDNPSNVVVSPSSTGLSPRMRLQFRKSLTSHFFGWDILLSLRMRLAVADFCWKLSNDAQRQSECGEVAQNLLNTISYRVLRTILRHLTAVVTLISPNEVPFVERMVVQSSLPGCPPELYTEAQSLYATVQASTTFGGHSIPRGLDELCPACHVVVPLLNITSAMCVNGHTWGRCSVTSFILSTPMVRTCVGCRRKTFLPLSQGPLESSSWLPPAARIWIVEELLESANRCLFCGNSFVSIL